MLGNATLKAIVRIDNLVIASITAATTALVSVTVPNAVLADGDLVIPQLRGAAILTSPVVPYAVVVDSTHIGLCLANGSAGAVDPADTFDWVFYVFGQTGNRLTGT